MGGFLLFFSISEATQLAGISSLVTHAYVFHNPGHLRWPGPVLLRGTASAELLDEPRAS